MSRRETLLDFFADLPFSASPYLIYRNGLVERTYTYRQLIAAAHECAHRFASAGLSPGDKVLIWSENRPEWLGFLWGALLAGLVVVPVDYRSSKDLLGRIQKASGARILIAGEETDATGWAQTPVWPAGSLEWPREVRPYPSPATSGDSVAQILFTSGTTAEPKGVLITHRNLLANIVPVEREVKKYLRYAKPFHPIRFLDLLPLSHLFGQSMAAFIPTLLTGTVVFQRGYDPRETVELVRRRRISVIVSVPKILEVLRDYVAAAYPEARQPAESAPHFLWRWWKYRRVHRALGWKFWAFIAGAAPLDPEVEEYWRRLGYVVIQGYGLTETAPIVTLNHPFHTRRGAVGKPIAGVEVRIAGDGEILVRGENVTPGYLNDNGAGVLREGWFHTGDIGSLDEEGRLRIRGRKKEMIVTPEGLNVFPDDIERVLESTAGVSEAAVVGAGAPGAERVHAVLSLEEGSQPEKAIREANQRLEDHQKIRAYSLWPGGPLPRTEGTGKLKRAELKQWVSGGGDSPTGPARETDKVSRALAQFTGGRALRADTTIDELGLSSLDRIQLLLTLEQQLGRPVEESQFTRASTVEQLQELIAHPPDRPPAAHRDSPAFPEWSTGRWPAFLRRLALPLWLLPLTRIFARIEVEGLEHLRDLQPPVVFAPNHQSHMDVPVILNALPPFWRYRVAPAMSREFFDPHFHPERYPLSRRFWNSLGYFLAALFFQAFPLSQSGERGRDALRFMGRLVSGGVCPLVFPEGHLTDTGEIGTFQPGIGMIASKLGTPVVPVRLVGLEKVLHRTWRWPSRGRVSVCFGKPLRLSGEDYADLAGRVRRAVSEL